MLIQTVILTLVIYSAIATLLFLITKENEDVAIWFGLGIIGMILVLLSKIIKKSKRYYEHRNHRSIIYCKDIKEYKWCKLKDTDDIYCWHGDYELKKRYAEKHEWKDLMPFDKEFIKYSKRNCDNCIHNYKECKSNDWDDKVLCSDNDKYEYFEKKRGNN